MKKESDFEYGFVCGKGDCIHMSRKYSYWF